MKSEQTGLPAKQSGKKSKLLPGIALLVGLCVPIYAYAYDQAACNACHNTCNNNSGYYGSQCSAMYPGCPQQITNCVTAMENQCHMNCQASSVCQ